MAMTPTPVRSGAGVEPGAGGLPPGLLEQLDRDLRAQVRADGVDPQREAELVRRMARDLVEGHDARSLTGDVLPVADVGGVVEELVARVAGFGPLQPLLEDPSVEEVWINAPSLVR